MNADSLKKQKGVEVTQNALASLRTQPLPPHQRAGGLTSAKSMQKGYGSKV